MATMYLAGDAKLWWRTRYDDIQNGRCVVDTWEDFFRELKAQFLPENVEYFARPQFRRLQHTGTVRDSVKKFSELMLDIRDMPPLYVINKGKGKTSSSTSWKA